MMKRLFYILAVALLPMMAQAKVVTGQVTDMNGEPIIGANVLVKGATTGTITDFDGNYSLDVPENAILVFSYLGMTTQELPVTGNTLSVVLNEDNQVLEEVVVTGYGTTKKRDLVTAVSSVNSDQLKDIPVASASEALQGKLAGVSVTTTEGAPDADVKVRVRGGTSLTQSNEPLYIVDGFPVSSISDIAPGDIASMDVLKDAAATAIYGAQGANGVIIITTKDSGAEDDKMTFHFDYSGYVGWKRMAKRYDMMSARDYVLMQYEYAYLTKGESGLRNNFNFYFDPQVKRDNKGKIPSSATLTPVSTLLTYWDQEATSIDWQRRTFGPTWGASLSSDDHEAYSEHQGFTSNHSISVSGGNKNANFLLSYNRVDDAGIMYGSNFARNNISFKGKFKPFKGFTIGTSARYSNTNVLGSGTNPSEDAGNKNESRVRNAVGYSPVTLVARDAKSLDDYDSFGSLYDPITTINHNYQTKKDNKWNIQGYASYNFLKKFTLRVELGYEARYRDQDRYYGPTSFYSRDTPGPGIMKDALGDEAGDGTNYGHIIVTDQRTSKLRNTNTFNYKDKWGSHSLELLVGEEQQWNKGSLETLYGYGYDPAIYDGNNVFNFMGAAAKQTFKNTINDTDNMLSFFARANYDYKGRYYLTATFRADCSTRFARGNQWGYFPSVAVAWRMSDEEWMQGASNWLSNLKLRFSYGTAGNNQVETGYLNTAFLVHPLNGAYVDNDHFASTYIYTGGSDAIAPNADLKWETTITRNFGIDYGFFNERLSGAIDLYWNNTNDLILLYKSSTGGYKNQYRNIGSTQNRGIEFSIKGVILDHKSKNLSYGLTVDANIAFNENKVVSLGGMTDYEVGTQCFSGNYLTQSSEFLVEPGQAIGRFYGYKTDGWYTPADFASYQRTNSEEHWYGADGKVISTILGEARPGMVKLVDDDKDGTPDKHVLGNALPLFNGGFNITAFVGGDKWGKVDFCANFTYSYGNDVMNMTALDFSTIYGSTKLRNLNNSVAYGNRYSMFDGDGNYIPKSIPVDASGYANYAILSSRLAEYNANAKMANPIMDNIALTDQFVEDASYLRLNNLTIGYSVAPKWVEKAKITQLRVFFQTTNVFCATKYSGADPEVDTRSKINPLAIGVDYSAYPKSRGFNIGLNLKF